MGEARVSSACRVERLVRDAKDLSKGEQWRPEGHAEGLQWMSPGSVT